MLTTWIQAVYQFLWGDLLRIPLPGGSSFGVSLLIILLIPTGIYFTIRTRFLPVRLFGDMVRALTGKKKEDGSLSTFQTLIVSTATRVGMGNLVGVVAAVSAGGAGAVFWMWITAIIGSSTAFIEATLAQLYKEKDPLYGGYRGGPAYYMHHYVERRTGKTKKHVCIAVLFAISGLICWAPLKTKNAYRTLPLSADAIDVLKAQKNKVGSSEWVFPSPTGGPMSPDSVLHMLQRVLKRAELPRIRFHDLRHTFATMALQNGVDVKTVSSMLGHYSAGFTLDTYAHVTTDAQLKAAQTMGNILSRAV